MDSKSEYLSASVGNVIGVIPGSIKLRLDLYFDKTGTIVAKPDRTRLEMDSYLWSTTPSNSTTQNALSSYKPPSCEIGLEVKRFP